MIRSILFFFPLWLCAQAPVVDAGRALFRSNCSFCHGTDGRGGRGPNLISAPLNHGDTDEAISRVIKKGVQGSTMPAFSGLDDDSVKQIIDYIHRLSQGVPRNTSLPGEPIRGREVYAKNGCQGCHQIGSEGSVFGPPLTRAGSGRPMEYLRESIVNPSADIPPEWEGITVVTASGKRVSGIRINEDQFSVQIRDLAQEFRSFDKDRLKELIYEKKSLMPAYKIAGKDLDDLVSYLMTLKGAADEGSSKKDKVKGIQ